MKHLALLLTLLIALFARAQSDPVSRSWNQPVEPFRIAGNLYYVGASDITSYLFATPEGHIVLDGGFVETAPMIAASIERLGFRVEDVRILIGSHPHYDHAGGLAELKRRSGARFLASTADAPLYARGGKDDPQFGDRYPFPPITADRLFSDGEQVSLGGTVLTARITPGHTPGCTTWTTTIAGFDTALLCSPTAPGYVLAGNPRYPNAIEDYRRQFAILRTLEPEIFLASHGNFFDLETKRKKHDAGHNAFVDPDGYRSFIATMETRFEREAARQSIATYGLGCSPMPAFRRWRSCASPRSTRPAH
jgi:metallo-beta-lactamase class B